MLRESVCVEKLEAIIFLVNLLCIYWGRSTAFISHFSLIWTHQNTDEKKFGPTKYRRRENLDPQNTHEKKFQTDEKKFGTHEIPTRKNFGPTIYPRGKITQQFCPHDSHNNLFSFSILLHYKCQSKMNNLCFISNNIKGL